VTVFSLINCSGQVGPQVIVSKGAESGLVAQKVETYMDEFMIKQTYGVMQVRSLNG